MYDQAMESMKLEKLKAFQEEKLKKIVRYAYDNVPLYRKRFKEHNVTPDDIKKLEDLHKLPFTVKTDLRDHYPYGILAVPMEKIVRIHASSGTTGKPTVVSYTQKDLEDWIKLMARCLSTAGVRKGDIAQNCYGYGLFTGGLGFHYGAERVGATVIPVSVGNTKRQIMLMKDMQTTVLLCTPSYAVYLAEAAKQEGLKLREDLKLRVGVFGAEPWSEGMRKKIQDEFGLAAFDMYGMSELYGPGVAVECEEHKGLHAWGDYFIVETINPETGEVIENGKKGELVFTYLQRESMPLLRYRSRDVSILNEEECACGRCHPRIMRVGGRSDDMLIVGGVNVFPSQIEHVLSLFPALANHYQIIVDRDLLDRLIVKAEVAEGLAPEPALEKKVTNELQSILGISAKVELVHFNTLERSEGKAKRVLDLRKKE